MPHAACDLPGEGTGLIKVKAARRACALLHGREGESRPIEFGANFP